MRLGFVGAGKVGGTLARLWAGAGVVAVYSRSPDSAGVLASAVGAQVMTSAAAVVSACDLTLLTVPDDAIALVAREIAAADDSLQGKMIVHTSGAHDMSVLEVLAAGGAAVGSLHPAYPFADVAASVAGLPGATFAVEAASARLRDVLAELVGLAGGHVLTIPAGRKVLYHAALVISSNYTVTLAAVASRLLAEIGADEETAQRTLTPLLRATVENIAVQGTTAALTGPLARGDVGTLGAHLRALDDETAALYRALGRATLPLAAARGLDATQLGAIEAILNDEDTTTYATQDNTGHPEDEGGG